MPNTMQPSERWRIEFSTNNNATRHSFRIYDAEQGAVVESSGAVSYASKRQAWAIALDRLCVLAKATSRVH